MTNQVRKLAQPLGLGDVVESVRPQLNALPGQLSGAIGSFTTVTANALNTIAAVVTIIVLTFFFLNDGARLVNAGLTLVPEAQRPRLRRLLDGSASAVSGYVTGNVTISLIGGLRRDDDPRRPLRAGPRAASGHLRSDPDGRRDPGSSRTSVGSLAWIGVHGFLTLNA